MHNRQIILVTKCKIQQEGRKRVSESQSEISFFTFNFRRKKREQQEEAARLEHQRLLDLNSTEQRHAGVRKVMLEATQKLIDCKDIGALSFFFC